MITRLVKADERSVAEAAALIRAGELVGFPTETVYGLGANVLHQFYFLPYPCNVVNMLHFQLLKD